MKKRVLMMLLGFTLTVCAYAQEASKDQFSKTSPDGKNKRYLTITSENDLFGSGTDQYYTNGLRLGWFEAGGALPEVTHTLQKVFPFLNVNETTTVLYSLGHNIYTPENIESSTLDINDRPWASFLYGSIALFTLTEDYLDEYELTAGVVGPSALGDNIQRKVHKFIDSRTPAGWHHQLKDEVGLMISWQRRWLDTWHTSLGPGRLSLSTHVGGCLGNVYTYAVGGGVLTYSFTQNHWHDKPLTVRPATPGTGFFVPSKELNLDLFLGLEGRGMVQNIFLDGNTFRRSHRVNKKPFVGDITAGFALMYRACRLGYSVVYRTKEFNRQNDDSIFGAVSLGCAF